MANDATLPTTQSIIPPAADDTHSTPVGSGGSSLQPEHEPLAFHFGNFSESPKQTEQQETESPPEALPSPLQNQPYTPPIVTRSPGVTTPKLNPVITQQHVHPPLPLSDSEIESNAKSKTVDASIHWLALWCIRQLEIYEKTIIK